MAKLHDLLNTLRPPFELCDTCKKIYELRLSQPICNECVTRHDDGEGYVADVIEAALRGLPAPSPRKIKGYSPD